jgi:hypothetical protein
MSHLCAYVCIMDPITSKLPLEECIESLYEHVDEFVVMDLSIYDKVDLSRYGKVRKHVKSLWNPFDNPFGSGFTSALNLCDSDTVMFLDADEIFDFKTSGLKDIIKRYPLDTGAGIAFSLRNYYCSRHFLVDGCSTKGSHIFKRIANFYHDTLGAYVLQHNHIRRTNREADVCDGVRLTDEMGNPTAHYTPIPLDEVVIHHTSHLDPVSKMVRSILQFNHTSTLDLPDFYPFDMRFKKSTLDKIYAIGEQKIKDGNLLLYSDPIPFEYEPNKLLDAFVKRANILEFDPTKFLISGAEDKKDEQQK